MSTKGDKAAPEHESEPRWKAPAFWALRLGLGALFVYAGAMKLGTPADFATEIANYHLGNELAPLMAVTMPTVEIVLGLGLIAGTRPWARAAALGAAALLAVFTVAVTTVVARGINVDCGCFGGNSGPVTMVTVLRDVVLFLCAAAIFRLSTKSGAGPGPREA
ncbi:MAG: MauE/DoxX family redox-associated membrane protein [Byssovorax sp.]